VDVVEDTVVSLFPQIPHDVDGHSVEVPPPISRHHRSCRLPPLSDARMVTWWIVLDNREVLPGGNLSPNRLGERAKQTKVLSSFQGPITKRTRILMGPATPRQVICRENFVLAEDPSENFALIFCWSLPNELVAKAAAGA